jgi:5-methylcytosine-specific restriction endonuclease McrA
MKTLSYQTATPLANRPGAKPLATQARLVRGSAEWRQVRARLLSDEPTCRACSAAGRTRLATDVDHIIPLSLGGEATNRGNLQPLCRSCHDAKSRGDRSAWARHAARGGVESCGV